MSTQRIEIIIGGQVNNDFWLYNQEEKEKELIEGLTSIVQKEINRIQKTPLNKKDETDYVEICYGEPLDE